MSGVNSRQPCYGSAAVDIFKAKITSPNWRRTTLPNWWMRPGWICHMMSMINYRLCFWACRFFWCC